MHRTRFIFGISVLFLAAGIVVTAQQGNGAPKSAHTTTPPKPNAANPATASPATAKPAPAPAVTKTTAKAPASTSAKTGKTPATKVAKADGKTPKPVAVAKTEKKSDKPSTATTTKSKTAAPTTAELSPVQQKLKQNANLAAKVESRLPKGTNLMAAAEGFRNLGQFVAAVNVSNSLSLSFDELKAKIVTGNLSLGQAIQAVRPLTASPTIEAQRAEYDARGLIAETDPSTTPKTRGPVTTPTSSPASTPTAVKTKAKATTKTSAQ